MTASDCLILKNKKGRNNISERSLSEKQKQKRKTKMEKNQTPIPPEEIKPEGKGKEKTHVLGQIAGGITLASTMVSCLSLFFIAMLGL